MVKFKIEKLKFPNEIKAELYFLSYSNFDADKIANDVLNQEELVRFNSFKSTKRKREFVATRKLKNEIIGSEAVFYNEDGRPMTKSFPNLSFSHSSNVCALAFADTSIGLDLEPIDEKVMRVRDKFLSNRERTEFDINDTETMIRIWSAKEALYKLAPQKGLIFSSDLIISKSSKKNQNKDEINLDGLLKIKGKTITYPLLSKKISNFIITINTNSGNEKP